MWSHVTADALRHGSVLSVCKRDYSVKTNPGYSREGRERFPPAGLQAATVKRATCTFLLLALIKSSLRPEQRHRVYAGQSPRCQRVYAGKLSRGISAQSQFMRLCTFHCFLLFLNMSVYSI